MENRADQTPRTSSNTPRPISVGTTLSIAAGAMLVIAFIDVITGPDFAFSIFYLIPVSFIAWRLGRFAGDE